MEELYGKSQRNPIFQVILTKIKILIKDKTPERGLIFVYMEVSCDNFGENVENGKKKMEKQTELKKQGRMTSNRSQGFS